MTDHPLRQTLNDELHGRAGSPLTSPARISHMAFTLGKEDADPLASIRDLASKMSEPEPESGTLHHSVKLERGFMRYERHGEFYRISLVAPGKMKDGVEALSIAPQDWLSTLPGQRLVAVHTHVHAASKAKLTESEVTKFFGHDDLSASSVSQELATIWTDFRIDGTGFTRILLQDHGLAPFRLGRVVRRIHEIETYRMMALLALPVARATQGALAKLEAGLSETVKRMPTAQSAEDDAALLNSLTGISRDVEELSNSTSYRFAASRAYTAIVEKRIAELGEARVNSFPRIGIFLDRRFTPAMTTCNATSARLAALAERCERASNLLRTRVDIALEGQNQSLLRSMDRRARQQLRLQETVEGLSVVAISYYLISIIMKFAESLAEMWPWLNMKLVTLLVVPATLALVWFALRRMRNRFAGKHE